MAMEDGDIDLYAVYETRANELIDKLIDHDRAHGTTLAYHLAGIGGEEWQAFVRMLIATFLKDAR